MHATHTTQQTHWHREMLKNIHTTETIYGSWAKKHKVSLNTVLVFDFLGEKLIASPSEMALACRLPKQTVNSILRELEKSGDICVNTNPKDARSKIITLSPAGEQRHQSLLSELHQAEQNALARMGMQKAKQMIELNHEFNQALQQELHLTP